jgi:hypothetical protein
VDDEVHGAMRWLGAVALAAGTFGVSPVTRADPEVLADPAVLRATLVCDQPAAPGRLRCDVEARGHRGALRWADVEIVSVAGFISPLRGRAGPREAATREDDLWRWSLGLVARERGDGDVAVRVRAVVCDGEACAPEVAAAVAHVAVGR